MKTLPLQIFITSLLAAALTYFAIPWGYFNIDLPATQKEYRLGLDLQGGIELDYKVDLTEASQESDYDNQREQSIIEGLKSIIDKRVQNLGINDSIITSSSYGDEEHIIVQIPLKGNDSLQNSANIERAKEAIGKVVKIEFKELRTDISDADREERTELANTIYNDIQSNPKDFSSEAARFQNTYENIATGTTPNIEALFSQSGSTQDLGILGENGISTPLIKISDGDQGGYLIYSKGDTEYNYILIGAEPSGWKTAQDDLGRTLDDRYFTKASVQYNEAFQPMIELTFNSEGAKIFGELTKRLVGEPMAIFVGGELLTAPTINEPILTGRAVITGNYTPESATQLAQDINTGVVPAPIYLTSERTIDARLGKNSLEKIVTAGAIGFLMVLGFLLIAYRISGLAAGIALFIYIMAVLAIVKEFGIVLTLASIAGLVLSIGIAIDANVLIFERVRDELRLGNSKSKSVKDGFDTSFSAIWDSNVTGLIVSLILYIFGINMIKGFGFILALGIFVSLLCVYFISRLYIQSLAQTKISDNIFIGNVKK